MERRLGVTSCTALVVANCVGAGVFTTSGFALEALGRPAWVLAAWVAGGAIALCGALSYLALARRYPISGGEYTFLSRMVHPLAGFLSGWVSLLAGFTAPIAAAALGLAAYVEGVLPFAVHARGSATAATAAATLLHGFRIDWGVRAQNAAVGAMLIAIAGFLFGRRVEQRRLGRQLRHAADEAEVRRGQAAALATLARAQVGIELLDDLRARRGDRLSPEADLFSGDIWVGSGAVRAGLVDGIGHLVPKMKERFGDDARFRLYQPRRGLLQRFGATAVAAALSGLEERAAFARLGL